MNFRNPYIVEDESSTYEKRSHGQQTTGAENANRSMWNNSTHHINSSPPGLSSAKSSTMNVTGSDFDLSVTEKKSTMAPSGAPAIRQSMNSSIKCLWDERLNEGGFIYFKHLRKAAGTSVRRYLETVIEYHYQNEINITPNPPKTPWLMYHQEWSAMPWNCPSRDPLWNKSINVIVLRDPIERQLSEFFYSGKGSSNLTMSRLGQRVKEDEVYEKEAIALMKELVPIWMDEGRDKAPRRCFNANYQTRMISGITTSPPKDISLLPKVKWRDGPCSFGPGSYGGARTNHTVDSTALEHAKAAVREFEILLLTETLSQPEQAAMVAHMVGVPESVATLARQRSNTKTNVAQSKSAVFKGYGDMVKRHDANLYELLRSTSELDIELYDYAVQMNREKTERWKQKMELSPSTHL